MKIQALGQSIQVYNKSNFAYKSNVFNTNKKEEKDVFVKQNSEISFSGAKKNNEDSDLRKEKNLGSSMKHVNIKGLPFLLGLATSAAMVKMGEKASALLCDANGYNVSEDGVSSELVNIDTENQILEFKGSGISIIADDYDYVDWENGIFRNKDGSVDINLGENRYIDTKNGIFVDPDEKISAVLDGKTMQSIAIPNFGSGYPTGIVDDRWGTMQQEYARRHPEMFEKKNPLEKATEFIKNIFRKDSMPQVDNMHDIFGNEIITAKDNDGDTYLASFLRKEIEENPVFADFKMKYGTEAAAEKINGARVEQYIQENYPSFGTRIMVYEGGRNATGNGFHLKHFNVADLDRDGRISEQELRNYLNSLSRDENGKLDEEGTAKFLELFDKNRDGKISLDEIKAVFDMDGNGSVSLSEILNFFDFNGDGITSLDEILEGILKLIFRRG